MIHTRHPAVPLVYAMSKPYAIINGYRVRLTWGENRLPCPPGVHHLDIRIDGFFPQSATITIDNRYAPAPPVYYALPWLDFQSSVVSHQPVKCPGETLAISLYVVGMVNLLVVGFVVMPQAGMIYLIPVGLIALFLCYYVVKTKRDSARHGSPRAANGHPGSHGAQQGGGVAGGS